MRTLIFSLGLGLLSTACGDDGGGGGSMTTVDGSMQSDAPPSTSCPRTPAAADRTRYVVIARPYTTDGSSSPLFEVLQLSETGTLTQFSTPRTFALGFRAPFGVITFTPDAEIGIVPLDNGKLGVFKLDPEGVVTVVDPQFTGTFYADRVVMDPSGDKAWVVDSNTRENGGGIYSISIACDGSLTDNGKVAEAKSPGGFALSGTKAIIAAREVLDSPVGDDVHVLDWSATPTVAGGGDAFGDDNQILSGFALSHDGTTAFIGDSNVVGTNRVAVVGVSATDITPLTVIANITDPSGIAASPFGDVALVTSSQPPNEGIYVLDKLGTNSTWRKRGELTYAGAAPELPGDVSMITQGSLTGSVLVSELSKVRRVTFSANGDVTDAGSLAFGDGIENIAGAIGVTP